MHRKDQFSHSTDFQWSTFDLCELFVLLLVLVLVVQQLQLQLEWVVHFHQVVLVLHLRLVDHLHRLLHLALALYNIVTSVTNCDSTMT